MPEGTDRVRVLRGGKGPSVRGRGARHSTRCLLRSQHREHGNFDEQDRGNSLSAVMSVWL